MHRSTSPRRGRLAATLAAVMLCASAGCAADDGVAPSALVGHRLDALTIELSLDTTLLVQDLSVLIDVVPSYDGNDDDGAWIVIAACADAADVFEATTVEVAVLPALEAPSDLDERIDAGEFVDAVSCDDGRTFR